MTIVEKLTLKIVRPIAVTRKLNANNTTSNEAEPDVMYFDMNVLQVLVPSCPLSQSFKTIPNVKHVIKMEFAIKAK